MTCGRYERDVFISSLALSFGFTITRQQPRHLSIPCLVVREEFLDNFWMLVGEVCGFTDVRFEVEELGSSRIG